MSAEPVPPVYFVRHGQTAANEAGLMCGGLWDIELTELGKSQALQAAKKLETLGLQSIVHSPLRRAADTAKIIARHLEVTWHVAPQMTFDEDWKEWVLGDWERRPFQEVQKEFLLGLDAPGGETRRELESRVGRAFARLADLKGPVLVVAHGGIWMALSRVLNFEAKRLLNGVPIKLHAENEASTPHWIWNEVD